MKAIDVLDEGYGNALATLGSAAVHAAGLGALYYGNEIDKKRKSEKVDTPVTPTSLEKPADKTVKKPPAETATKTDTVKDNKDMDPTSDDKSVNGKLFHDRLQSIAKDLGVSTSNLLRIMEMESGMDPAARNPDTNARGLIQFKPKTALSTFGKTADWIATLSAYDQLVYVWEFYRQNKLPKGASLGDMYLATFMPAALSQNKPDNFVLGRKGAYKQTVWDVDLGKNWDQNGQFAEEAERNGRDYFTVGDVKKVIQTKH